MNEYRNMTVVKDKSYMHIRTQFPYTLKPPSCRLQDIKKQEKNNKKMIYVKCSICGGRVEKWEDEKIGYCLDCKRTQIID